MDQNTATAIFKFLHFRLDDRRIITFSFDQLSYFIRSITIQPSELRTINLLISTPPDQIKILFQQRLDHFRRIDIDIIRHWFCVKHRRTEQEEKQYQDLATEMPMKSHFRNRFVIFENFHYIDHI